MRRARIALVAVAAAISGALYAAQAPATAAARLDQRLRAAVERGDIPGVVAMAADRNGVIYSGAFGTRDTAHRRPMTADTIFRIASMTKAVTSAALMQLVEQQRVGLDDPAPKYLPAFRSLEVFESFSSADGTYRLRPAKRPPTVRELLTHTSGLAYTFVSPTVRDFKPRDGETFDAGPLLFDPGQRWHYGPSTLWVGRMVEAVSSMTLETYLHDRVFQPLGMRDTSFNVRPQDQSRVAAVHARQRDGSLVEQPSAPVPTVTEFRGDGGLFSTAIDYIRFEQMVLNDGRLNGAAILSPKTIEAMAANQIGALTVPALKTAMPERSSDFTFVDDGRDKWGLGFLITTRETPGKRSAGSLSWGGIDNTYFWIDRRRGVAGVIMMQFLPFADAKALNVYDVFERGTYEILHDLQRR
jgi:CubicO group peptidase (beta-lactamase class C family)